MKRRSIFWLGLCSVILSTAVFAQVYPGKSGGVKAFGSAVANQIAIWASGSSIKGDPNFTWDPTNKTLTIAGTGTGVNSIVFPGNAKIASGSAAISNNTGVAHWSFNQTTDVFGSINITQGGQSYGMQYTDNSGSPGATTINNPSGRAAIASAASSVVVTDSVVSATSKVLVQLESTGVGVGSLVVVPAAGSFTVTSVNGTGVATVTTGAAKFSFVVFN